MATKTQKKTKDLSASYNRFKTYEGNTISNSIMEYFVEL